MLDLLKSILHFHFCHKHVVTHETKVFSHLPVGDVCLELELESKPGFLIKVVVRRVGSPRLRVILVSKYLSEPIFYRYLDLNRVLNHFIALFC